MTKTFAASVKGWSAKALRNADLIVKQASRDVYREMTQTQASSSEGGGFVTGRVPVDTGFLIGSVQVSLNGAVRASGSPGQPAEFVGVLAGMKMGDVVEAAFTAAYARHVEYGTAHMGGRFFVRNAIAQWPAFVAGAAARLKG